MTQKPWIVRLALMLGVLTAGAVPAVSAAGIVEKPAAVELRVLPGTPFAEGDQLVAGERGQVEWYRGGRRLATLADPAGLVTAGRAAALAERLVLVDAAGRPVHELAGDFGAQALVLSTGPPAHVFQRRGHRFNPRAALVTYHGGLVMGATRTVAIFWGPEWADSAFAGDTIDSVDGFLAGFGGSPYAGILKEYATQEAKATSASTYLGHVFDPTPPPSHALSPEETLDEACKIAGDHPDPAAIYMIYTSTGLAAPVEFCAYHTWWTCAGGAPVQAAYMPNLDRVRACQIKDTLTHRSPGTAAIINSTAHELVETITDPRGEGWYDAQKDFTGEVGDKCAYVFGRRAVTLANGTQWQLQTEWSNAAYLKGKGLLNPQRQAGCVQQ